MLQTTEPPDGHLLPEDAWALVQAGAGDGPRSLLSTGQRAILSSLPPIGQTSRIFVQCKSYGGTLSPLGGTLHSAETPLKVGYAESIARNWFAGDATTSAHFMIDPAVIVQMLALNRVAYHVGKGNPHSIGWEQAGYARFSRTDWLSDLGLAQMRNLAASMREVALALGWPLQWASEAEVRACVAARRPFGFITHDDNRRIFGGTTHTDPMPNYPKDDLMDLIRQAPTSAPPTMEDDMTPEQANQLKAVYEFLMEQERVPGQGFSWSHANTDRLDALKQELQVPGAPYAWLPAINNKIDDLEKALAAVKKKVGA